MKNKVIVRVTSVVISLILATILLLSVIIPSLGKSYAYDAQYIRQFTDSLITNRNQYFDSSVVYELPSGVKDTDEISVIISLSNPALLDEYNETNKEMSFTEFAFSERANQVRAEIASEKEQILATFKEQGIEVKTGADYSAILTGFEVIIKAGDFKTMSMSLDKDVTPIVCEVYKKAETQLVENKVNVNETGIFNSKEYIEKYGYDGTGMVVAVLDTGLDYTHSAFSVSNFTADKTKLGLTKAMVAQLVGSTKASTLLPGLTEDDVYVNEKVPFSFDYADRDPDVYSLHNNHGTHVSGVIVGKDDTITGVAPNAQLVAMKIFSDTKDSAIASWILSALEDCVILGVDVINMSLGTACGFSRESDEEKISGVYEKIRAQGISLVVAASNSFTSSYGSEKNGNLGLTSNPDTATVGSPSTYEGALSIASINGIKTPYILYNGKIVYFTESSDSSAEERYFVDGLLKEGVNDIEIEYVLIPGVGRDAEYTGIDVKGKIALVKRGDTTFEEKAQAAEKAGALGVIVYNNISGDIRMNVGTVKIPVCSISQEDGEVLAAAKRGTIKISRDQTSGPFMSDFSSWGPSPSLGIKPELTAHGGNILSAITGGGYDRLSGTSMACPNTAGVIILLRQYVIDKFPEIKNDPVKVTALVNQLLMSTADIVYNKNGLPYAVRKQGAGLANLESATETKAIILTYNKDGSVMDKSKLEIGDDAEKTGVYELNFSVYNFGTAPASYILSTFAMTEGVSDVRTHKGETTVTEEGYLLEGATVSFTVENGTQNGDTITVEAGKTAKIKVTITLSDEDKKYLDESFENGMYIEGFVELDATGDTKEDLSVPYLAFYGDWTEAPILDLDYFETNKDELNDSIPTLDKTLPDAYATRPIGGMFSDYISYLGSYYFQQNPANQIISASRDYIALSNVSVSDYATEADQDIATIHSLRFIWTGMLRNAEKVVVTITDDATGEVIHEVVDDDVRKSYGDGGSYLYPANVEVEFDVAEHNLKNNTKYTVRLVAYMDYGNGGLETNEKNVFEFPFTTDFEAPAVTDCTFRSEYDSDKDRMRLFASLAVYDNHYAMSMQPGYIKSTVDENNQMSYELIPFESYMTPIYSVRNGTTYVEYELTDYIYDLKNSAHAKNSFVVSVYDYALNHATYEIGLPDEFVDFFFDLGTDEEGNPNTGITLSPNELYTMKLSVYPNEEENEKWGELLVFTSSDERVVKIVNNKLVALKQGRATIEAKHPNDPTKKAYMTVNVLGENDEGFQYFDKPVAEVFAIKGYKTLFAFDIMDSNDKDIGETGITKFFGATEAHSVKMFPSESIQLLYSLKAYFPDDTEIVFATGNDKVVSVDQNGVITANEEGFSNITISLKLDGSSTFYTETLSVEVKDPFVRTAPTLTHYYGNGGLVEIPADLLLTKIGAFAFSNYEWVPKTEAEYLEDDSSRTKQSPIGNDTITKIIIPEGIKTIDAYAFARLTALKEVVLPSTIENIEYGAFAGCTKLEKVTGIENVQLINYGAFEGCNLKGTLKLDKACAIGDFCFASNPNLEKVEMSDKLQSIGASAFAYCRKLTTVSIGAEKAKLGTYVFSDCSSLTTVKANASVIPEGAFMNCSSLENLTIGKDVGYIGELAFAGTKISQFKLDSANTVYKVSADGKYLLTKDGKTLLLAAPTERGSIVVSDASITAIGNGAFASNKNITSIKATGVTMVKDYAFYGCSALTSVTLGKLSEIGSYAFYNTAISTLPALDGLDKIGENAFAYTDLTVVTIPNGMVVGNGAFYECDKLHTVVIGDDVVIGDGAFMTSWSNKVPVYIKDDNYTTKVYYPHIPSALKSLTIGKNAVIGDSAFYGSSELKAVTLDSGAKIGRMAFYNCYKLESIELENVITVGEYAFSGDEYQTASSAEGAGIGVDEKGYSVSHIYATKLSHIAFERLESLGAYAFALCPELIDVLMSQDCTLTEIPERAFAKCYKLSGINLSESVTRIGLESFGETAVQLVCLPSNIEYIDNYAFAGCTKLEEISLGVNGTDLGEGVFAYCEKLSTVTNLEKVKKIGAYAFALTDLRGAKLSSAVEIGNEAFMKETMTDFDLDLGENKVLSVIGDNPFALCRIDALYITETMEFNGKEYPVIVYDFDISETVHVINGSIYADVPNGLELITYASVDDSFVEVADGTVRITAYAFAGHDIVRVKLPYTVNAIGHKAFYDCDELITVIFNSYTAPTLEEEFDQSYFTVFNIPASSGDTAGYEYYDEEGNLKTTPGLGVVPYFMFNPMVYTTQGIYPQSANYYSMYYGGNFVNMIGHGNPELIMIRPSNGQEYDSFIMGQYFTTVIDGSVAPDKITIAAIEAIDRLPDKVMLSDKPLVVAARLAYDKIATLEQQALVTNYGELLTAEQRIKAFESGDNQEPEIEEPIADTTVDPLMVVVIVESVLLGIGIIGAGVLAFIKRKAIVRLFTRK
ncbi:MAG: leucine-rich repeat protein [Clostridia bacterium]|nr:leucine-rich repeat protein [Clostridia bacterium]